MEPILVSTPSRLCLFGEHQDYLGLEVVALAINLRFSARVTPTDAPVVRVRVLEQVQGGMSLGGEPTYTEQAIDLNAPIVYAHKRDYLKSAVKLLRDRGYPLAGCEIEMTSQIPIGKGMCSSTTMIMVLIKALLERIGHPDKDDPARLAMLGFDAEVTEFGEPGGKMDHLTSAYGGLVHLDFADGVAAEPIDRQVPGRFIVFDSRQGKDTLKVLASAKTPVLEALETLAPEGVASVRDFLSDPGKQALLDKLDPVHRRKLAASIDNHRLLRQALRLWREDRMDPATLGRMIYRHHCNLRDGLGISTDTIEAILDTALRSGALGGKINGSGGGGCGYCYALEQDAPRVLSAIRAMGYPAMVVTPDTGIRREN